MTPTLRETIESAAHEMEVSIRFAESGIKPTGEEVAEWKLALASLRAALAAPELSGNDGWVMVPRVGTLVSADHPVTPEPTLEVTQVCSEPNGNFVVRGEGTEWFDISMVHAAAPPQPAPTGAQTLPPLSAVRWALMAIHLVQNTLTARGLDAEDVAMVNLAESTLLVVPPARDQWMTGESEMTLRAVIRADQNGAPSPAELRDWADNPASLGFVPVQPDTLRRIADALMVGEAARKVLSTYDAITAPGMEYPADAVKEHEAAIAVLRAALAAVEPGETP